MTGSTQPSLPTVTVTVAPLPVALPLSPTVYVPGVPLQLGYPVPGL